MFIQNILFLCLVSELQLNCFVAKISIYFQKLVKSMDFLIKNSILLLETSYIFKVWLIKNSILLLETTRVLH